MEITCNEEKHILFNRNSELLIFTLSLGISLPPMLIGIYIWTNVFRHYKEIKLHEEENNQEGKDSFFATCFKFLFDIINVEYNHDLVDTEDRRLGTNI